MKKVAESKKKTNVGEYIIYMYQMEDLIRVYDFDLKDLRKYVLSHYPVTEEERSGMASWFDSLIDRMEEENIRDQGHLKEVQQEVDKLARIHWELLKEDREYFGIYNLAKPYIMDFVLAADGKPLGHEIQICLNGVYGLLLNKLSGKKIPEDLQKAAEAFGTVLSYLNVVYQEREGSLGTKY